jgi:hypothetical protein
MSTTAGWVNHDTVNTFFRPNAEEGRRVSSTYFSHAKKMCVLRHGLHAAPLHGTLLR